MARSPRRRWTRLWGPPVGFVLAICLLAELLLHALHVPTYILPLPSAVLSEIWKTASGLARDAGITTGEAVTGFALAAVGGTALAIMLSLSGFLERAAYPLVVATKCTPLVAVAPILALWFGGNSLVAKSLMAAFICFFPVVVNVRAGLNAIDDEALDLFRSLSASRWKILWTLRFPSSIGYLLSSLKTASTLAVIGAVVGEFAVSDRGLGYRIVEASYDGDTPKMFASVLLLMIIGIAFFGLICLAEVVLSRKFRLGVRAHNDA